MRLVSLLLVGCVAVGLAPACGDDDDDTGGDGDADADADSDGDGDGDGDADAHPCGDLCAGSDRCIRAQVVDFVTGDPVSADDNLQAIVNDPLTEGGPTIMLTVPVDQPNGCFVARDLEETSADVRLVDITEVEGEPDSVALTSNWAGPGNVTGTCCDFPMTVVTREEEEAWSAALGLADGEGVEATGSWAGFIMGADGPMAGATLTNSGADELRAHYFNDDMSDFVDGALETSASGAWVVMMATPPFELGNFSARDTVGTAYGSATAGMAPGQITPVMLFPQ